jgi:hypothetical protein
MIKTNNTTNLKNISKYLLTTTLTLGLLSATNTVHPAPTYIPDRVWFCDKDKQVYH